MSVFDVAREEWAEFLQSFSRRHRGWLASVEQSDAAGTSLASEYRPLAAVTPEWDGARISTITISFAGDSGAPVRIGRPAAVRVERTGAEGDTEPAMEIVDEGGGRTRVEFRATATPEMLDGVAPAELQEP